MNTSAGDGIIRCKILDCKPNVRYHIRVADSHGDIHVFFPKFDKSGHAEIILADNMRNFAGNGCSSISVPEDVVARHVADWCYRGYEMNPDDIADLDTDYSSYASDEDSPVADSSVWNTSPDSSSNWDSDV